MLLITPHTFFCLFVARWSLGQGQHAYWLEEDQSTHNRMLITKIV